MRSTPSPHRGRGLVVLCSVLLIAAQPAPTPEPTRAAGDLVLIPAERVIAGDLYATGGRAQIDGTVQGDLLAGFVEEVVINGTVEGDATVVAGSVHITGAIAGSARVLAGSVTVDGSIAGDLVTAAWSVTTGPGGSVGVDLMTAAVRLLHAGSVGDDLLGRVWRGIIQGGVGDNVELDARRLSLGPDAEIGGDLRYRSPVRAELAEGSEVEGTVTRNFRLAQLRARSLLGVTWLLGALAFLAGGLLVLLAAPGWSGRAAASVRRSILICLLVGVATLAAVALALAVVAGSMLLAAPELAVPVVAVASPFLLGALGGLVLGLFLGGVPVGVALGGAVARRSSRFTHFLVAAPLLIALPFVPTVGWPLLALVSITGLGAWVRSIRRGRRRAAPPAQPDLSATRSA